MPRLRKMLLLALGILVGLFLLAVLLVGGLLLYVAFQKRQYAQLADTHDLKPRIEQMGLNYVKQRTNAGLIIGFIQCGEKHIKGFGRVSETNPVPPDATTIFEIGSVTKVFTAITLAKMSADGFVKLDDPISLYLPKDTVVPQKDGEPITLGHLATHTAGLPRLPANFDDVSTNEQNPYVDYKVADLYRDLASVKLSRKPGTRADYSNYGFGLLGHMLELRAGKAYEQLVTETICQPLDMSHTSIHLSDEQRRMLSLGHDAKGRVVPNWDFDVLAPAGAFRSNAEDLLKFLEANLGDSPLSKILQQTHRRYFQGWSGDCGLGWQMLHTLEGLKLIWHNGGTGGYVSFIGFDPRHRTGVVILSNYGDAFANDDTVDKMGFEILKLASKISLSAASLR